MDQLKKSEDLEYFEKQFVSSATSEWQKNDNPDQSFYSMRNDDQLYGQTSKEDSFVSLYRLNKQCQHNQNWNDSKNQSFTSINMLNKQQDKFSQSQIQNRLNRLAENVKPDKSKLQNQSIVRSNYEANKNNYLCANNDSFRTVMGNTNAIQPQQEKSQLNERQQNQSNNSSIRCQIIQSSFQGMQQSSDQKNQPQNVNKNNDIQKVIEASCKQHSQKKRFTELECYQNLNRDAYIAVQQNKKRFSFENNNQFQNVDSISSIASIKPYSRQSQSELSYHSDIQSNQIKELHDFFYRNGQFQRYRTISTKTMEQTKLMIKKLQQGQNHLRNLITSYHLRLQLNNLSNKANYQQIVQASKEMTKQTKVNGDKQNIQANLSKRICIKQQLIHFPNQMKIKLATIQQRTKKYRIKPNFTRSQKQKNIIYKKCAAQIWKKSKNQQEWKFKQFFNDQVQVHKNSQNNYQILFEYLPDRNIVKISLNALYQKMNKNHVQIGVPTIIYNCRIDKQGKQYTPQYKTFYINYSIQVQSQDLILQQRRDQNANIRLINLQAKYATKRFLLNGGVYKELNKCIENKQIKHNNQENLKSQILLDLQQSFKIPLPMIYFFEKRFQHLTNNPQINIDGLLAKIKSQFYYYEICIQGQLQQKWVELLHKIFDRLFDLNLQSDEQQGKQNLELQNKQYWLSLRGHDEIVSVQLGNVNQLGQNTKQVLVRIGGKYGSQIVEDIIQFLCFMIAA